MEDMVGMHHWVVGEMESVHRRVSDWYFQRFPVADQAHFPLWKSHFSVHPNTKLHTLCPFRLLVFRFLMIIGAIAHCFGHVGVGIQSLEAWDKRYWSEYLVWNALSISPSVFAERTMVPFCKRAIECAT